MATRELETIARRFIAHAHFARQQALVLGEMTRARRACVRRRKWGGGGGGGGGQDYTDRCEPKRGPAAGRFRPDWRGVKWGKEGCARGDGSGGVVDEAVGGGGQVWHAGGVEEAAVVAQQLQVH